jgi:hypothetical protein
MRIKAFNSKERRELSDLTYSVISYKFGYK